MYRLFLAFRYLRCRLVNLIAVGGVAVGVGVLIVVTAIMDGFRHEVLTVLRGNLSDVILTPKGEAGTPLPSYEVVDRMLRQDPRVHASAPRVSVPVFYLYEPQGRAQLEVEGHAIHMMTAEGIDFPRESRVSKIAEYLVVANDRENPFYSRWALDRERRGTVLVSRTFAKKFPLRTDRYPRGEYLDYSYWLPRDLLESADGRTANEVGITFVDVASPPGPEGGDPAPAAQGNVAASWRTYALTISGVYDAKETTADVARIFMDLEALRALGKVEDPYTEIRVKLERAEDAPAFKAHLSEADFFRDHFDVTVWQDHRRDYLRAVNNEKVLLAIVLSFIVLLGGFVILATLTLTVVEKTHDIGVLSALGAHRGGILSMFLGTGLLIGLLGSLLGLGLGWLFTDNVNGVKDFLDERMGVEIFPSDIYLFENIPTIWDWGTVLWIVGGSILVAFLAGYIPALRAARMDPVRALRYE